MERDESKDVPLSVGFAEILRRLAVSSAFDSERRIRLLRLSYQGQSEIGKARVKRDLKDSGPKGKIIAQKLSKS